MIDIKVEKKLHGANGDMNLTVDLSIEEGEFVALTGESGSGKTTLLRVLSGLEEADAEIKVGGKTWQDSKQAISVQKREIGFVFQDYALFTNMSVEENLLYVNRDKNLAKHLLELTELEELKNRLPNTLSGGQKQRVSLCRALMNRPKLLLMDEPLSALDLNMRNRLQSEILTLHKEFGTTIIMVSHDPSEIYRLANRVLVMNHGEIIDDGTPKSVLLETSGSQKFSFEGELLDIVKVDVIYVAIVTIGQQLVEVVVSKEEVKSLTINKKVRISTKAFTPSIVQAN